jgi:crotonobetainyl-CoA:carnitine CoA-transferase CaiB-like acyl-CoA transferase
MGGFAARFGDGGEGARATATYYPDAVAGVHATLAALSALAARERTGFGSAIDLSQQETRGCARRGRARVARGRTPPHRRRRGRLLAGILRPPTAGSRSWATPSARA